MIVLLADEHPERSARLMSCLRMHGIVPLYARDYQMFLDDLHAIRFDGAIVSSTLPGCDPETLFESLRMYRPGSALPSYVFGNRKNVSLHVLALRYDVLDVVPEDIAADDLVVRIRDAVQYDNTRQMIRQA